MLETMTTIAVMIKAHFLIFFLGLNGMKRHHRNKITLRGVASKDKQKPTLNQVIDFFREWRGDKKTSLEEKSGD